MEEGALERLCISKAHWKGAFPSTGSSPLWLQTHRGERGQSLFFNQVQFKHLSREVLPVLRAEGRGGEGRGGKGNNIVLSHSKL